MIPMWTVNRDCSKKKMPTRRRRGKLFSLLDFPHELDVHRSYASRAMAYHGPFHKDFRPSGSVMVPWLAENTNHRLQTLVWGKAPGNCSAYWTGERACSQIRLTMRLGRTSIVANLSDQRQRSRTFEGRRIRHDIQGSQVSTRLWCNGVDHVAFALAWQGSGSDG